MTVARTFEKDVFISYSHIDDETASGMGWISTLHEYLAVRLCQLYGTRREAPDAPTIWRDKQLQSNQDFSKVLNEELGKVAMLVSVLSPGYMKSAWCQREIDNFCKAAEARLGLEVGNHQMRAIKVIKTPIDRAQHPAPLKAATGYEFYVEDKELKRAREFTLVPSDENYALMLRKVDDLAYNIKDTLEQINAAQPLADGPAANGAATAVAGPVGAAAAAAAAAKGGPQIAARPTAGMKVYLAEAHDEFHEDRAQLLRELASHGLRVLPAAALPRDNAVQFRAQVGAALADCDLAVHLVGAGRAAVLPDEDDDLVVLQNTLAAECSAKTGLRRLIWLPEHKLLVPPATASQRQFIEKLHRDTATQQGAELLTRPLQELIVNIHDGLEKLRISRLPPERPVVSVAAIDGGPPPAVYLLWHPADAALADTLRNHLFDLGFNVLEPLSEPDSTEDAIDQWHKSNLEECAAMLVCVGQADVNWWRAQSGGLLKAEGQRGGRKLAARGVYLGPPSSQFKTVLRMQGVVVCNGMGAFDPAVLQGFIGLARQPVVAP